MTALICMILSFIKTTLDLNVPVYDLSDSTYETLKNSLTVLCDFVNQVNFLIPLSDIAFLLSIDLALRIFKFALFMANWLVRRIIDIIP